MMRIRSRPTVGWLIALTWFIITFGIDGFNSPGPLLATRTSSKPSLVTLRFNENDPFDDIRVTNAIDEDVPSDLPKDIQQDTVDETLHKEKTLYEILGADPTATRAELKRCYVLLAKATHPDALIGRSNNANVDGSPPMEDFNDIAAAWRILGDAKLRKRYDFDLKAKAFADEAQRSLNEKLEEAAPVIASMVDNVAATTVAVGDVMGKGLATFASLQKKVQAAQSKIKDQQDKLQTERSIRAAKLVAQQKAQEADEQRKAELAEARRKRAELAEARAIETEARRRTAEAIATKQAEEMNVIVSNSEYRIMEAGQLLADEQAWQQQKQAVAPTQDSTSRSPTGVASAEEAKTTNDVHIGHFNTLTTTDKTESFEDFLKSSTNTARDDNNGMDKYLEQL